MDPFIGEIRLLPYTFNPVDWLWCDGTLLPLSQYTSLFAIIGTTYGGNGQTNFGIPNLNGRAVLGAGTSSPGATGGVAGVSLANNQVPSHTHTVALNNAQGTSAAPVANGNIGGVRSRATLYIPEERATRTPMSSQQLGAVGAGGAHENRQPYLTIGYCIAYNGIFPPRP